MTEPPWDLAQLRDLVEARWGLERGAKCWRSLQSLHERQQFAGYHFREYKRLIDVRFPPGRILDEEFEVFVIRITVRWSCSIMLLRLQALSGRRPEFSEFVINTD